MTSDSPSSASPISARKAGRSSGGRETISRSRCALRATASAPGPGAAGTRVAASSWLYTTSSGFCDRNWKPRTSRVSSASKLSPRSGRSDSSRPFTRSSRACSRSPSFLPIAQLLAEPLHAVLDDGEVVQDELGLEVAQVAHRVHAVRGRLQRRSRSRAPRPGTRRSCARPRRGRTWRPRGPRAPRARRAPRRCPRTRSARASSSSAGRWRRAGPRAWSGTLTTPICSRPACAACAPAPCMRTSNSVLLPDRGRPRMPMRCMGIPAG